MKGAPFWVEHVWWCPTCKQIRRHPAHRIEDRRYHSLRHDPMIRVVMELSA